MMTKDKDFFQGSTFAFILLIAVLTSLVYANSLRSSFAGDDFSIIVNNDFIKSWKNFPIIFNRRYLDSTSKSEYTGRPGINSGEKTYRPVVTVTYFIDYFLWRLNPTGYHLTNLILHISNVILLYFFIGLITKDRKIALLASLFFGLHPVNSEAVNAIGFREDMLVCLFFISSFILFIKSDYYEKRKRLFCYIASIILFLLALFSKEMAITLPILLILYDYYFVFPESPKKLFFGLKSRYIGYIAVFLFYLWIRFFIMFNPDESMIEYPGGNFYVNLLTMSRVFATYLNWLLFPVDVHVTMHEPSFFLYSFFRPEALFSLLSVIACLLLAILLYRRSKPASFAILWFFITLLPVSNMMPLSNIIASRYLYIPAVGFCLLAAILLNRMPTLKIYSVPAHLLKRVAIDTILVLVIFYSVFTIMRGLTWRNDIALWSEAVEYYPDSAPGHRGLGDCFAKRRLLNKAISEYEAAINLEPYHVASYDILGVCCGEKRLYKKAIAYFKQAIAIDPWRVQSYNNLGVTYGNMENWDEAKAAWEKALEIEPEDKIARDNLKKLRALGH